MLEIVSVLLLSLLLLLLLSELTVEFSADFHAVN